MTKLQPVRGTHDIMGDKARRFRFINKTFQDIAQRFGHEEISTPIFEFTEVFKRTLGETSDVVSKEMYTFEDRGGESLTL
ncbi:MAG: histidine--tRNA ligase, partial [Alphaproteobacteria bacterium]